MRHALVLGGTGFISSHCVSFLLKSGFEVTTVTRGRTHDPHGPLVKRILVSSNSKQGRKDLRRAVRESPTHWDVVVDCICFERSDVKSVVRALQGRMKLYVMISTDSVYEVCTLPPRTTGIREEDDGLLPLSKEQLVAKDDYGFDKWRCEQALRDLAVHHGEDYFPFVCLRLPDVVGENEVPKSRHFEYQIRVERGITVDLPIHNGPRPLSFVYVQDVASAVLAVVNAPLPTVCGQSFNIASKEGITMEEYLREISKYYQHQDLVASTAFEMKRGKKQKRERRHGNNNNNSSDDDNESGNEPSNVKNNSENNDDFCSRSGGRSGKSESKSESSQNKSRKSDNAQEEWRSRRSAARLFTHAERAREWFPSVECGPLDISKALRLLGWSPTPFSEWMHMTCAWYASPQNRGLLQSKVLGEPSSSSSSSSDDSSSESSA